MAAGFSQTPSTTTESEGLNHWLVILNNSLADSELHRLLKMQQLRIKGQSSPQKYNYQVLIFLCIYTVSSGTLPHTCLYPQSSIAFMILPTSSILTSWPPTDQSKILPQLSSNIEKFSKLHHRCYILVSSPLIGSHEQAAIGLLQENFLTANVQFLPMHNSNECVTCMQNVAKLTCKPLSTLVQKRMADLESQLESEDSIMSILRGCGLKERECVMVLDGCGGLSGLAQATEGELMDLNLDQGTIRSIMNLIHY